MTSVQEAQKLLQTCLDFLRDAPLESGICCCGNPIEKHGYYDGHSPVDELSYYSMLLSNKIQTFLDKSKES
jgi:hypothetical protein